MRDLASYTIYSHVFGAKPAMKITSTFLSTKRELLPFGFLSDRYDTRRRTMSSSSRGRIYIYRLASILQSNVIYEADPPATFSMPDENR